MTVVDYRNQIIVTTIGTILSVFGSFEYRIYILVAVFGAFAGSFLFSYFEREKNKIEIVIKALLSGITGLIVGAYVAFLRQTEAWQELLIIFFMSGMLSLIVLKLLYGVIKLSGKDIIRTILFKIFEVKDKDK